MLSFFADIKKELALLLFIVSGVMVYFSFSGVSADSSVQSAGTAVSTADILNCSLVTNLNWISASNSTAQDDTNASVTHATFDTNDITHRLDTTNFSFALPSGSTISGIVVELDKYTSAGNAVDYRVQLLKAGSLAGSNKADTATAWALSDTDTYISYGGSSDLWGTTWTESEVENTGFGVAICAKATSNNTDVHVDHIRITTHYTAPDTTAPAAVADLAASSPSNSAITLTWTSPGDDGSSGTATSYDLRYSTSNITDANWPSATQATGEQSPSVAGSSENVTVTGLLASTLYYFAMKTSDEVPNESGLSNVASLSTTATPDSTAPAAVTNLAAANPTASSIGLSWTAPGDDGDTGTATMYDIRYSTGTITDGNWPSAIQITGEPTPSVAGSSESKVVSGLSASTLYYFAMKTSDEAANGSGLSNVPSLVTSAASIEPSIIIPEDTGGGGGPTDLTFSGQAYPGADIEILRKDNLNPDYTNVPVATKIIEPDGAFLLRYQAFLTGQYFFSLRAIDTDGRQTGVISFPVDFKDQGGGFTFEDIRIPPTVGFDISPVMKGTDVNILGYAPAGSSVELEVDDVAVGTTTVQASGLYSFTVHTQDKTAGSHQARTRWILGEKKSDYSSARSFKVSTLANPRADFTGDDMVTIADWSIFLFRWGSKESVLRSKIDMNDDGKVDIRDLSIFLKAMKI